MFGCIGNEGIYCVGGINDRDDIEGNEVHMALDCIDNCCINNGLIRVEFEDIAIEEFIFISDAVADNSDLLYDKVSDCCAFKI